MKYNGPFDQPTNPNASFQNGNPAAGIQGSIPPASAIEYPQREIVNFITDSGLTPTNSDLHQLSESVQSGGVSFALDTGSTNELSVTLVPPPPAYKAGLLVRVLIGNNITGATTLNCNALGAKTALLGGSALTDGILNALDVGEFCFDGTYFQLIGGQRFGIYTRQKLLTPTTLYINPATGSDSYNGLTSGTAFATLQHAWSYALTLDLNGQTLTFSCAAVSGYLPLNASGTIPGQSGPQSIIFLAAGGITLNVTGATWCFQAGGGAQFMVSGPWILSNESTSNTNGGCIQAYGGGSVIHTGPGLVFNTATNGAHISAILGGNIFIGGSYTIGNVTTAYHYWASTGSIFSLGGPFTITISGSPFWSCFASAAGGVSYIGMLGITFAGGASTGTKYSVNAYAWINTYGAGADYFPGDTAGAVVAGTYS